MSESPSLVCKRIREGIRTLHFPPEGASVFPENERITVALNFKSGIEPNTMLLRQRLKFATKKEDNKNYTKHCL